MAQQIAKVVQSAAPTVTVVTGTAGVVSTGADIISIVAKHPDFQQHLQRILGAKTPAELQDALSALSQYGAVAEAFGLVYARTHKPTIANNMAGGRNVPDIGVQHPSNQNMMQMDNGGTKGVNLPNSPDVPQGIQNQAHPTQPGTAITQPSQPGQPYNNQPNQVNPNTQPNAPGSPQHTPLQNIKGTIYSANNPPSITDRTPSPPRRNPTNSQELDRQRQRGDWHENDDWDLELHDELGGHSGKHIYATWEETANRILRFGSANRIGNASSRFIDVASANRLAHETLKANSAKIEKWLRNPNAKKPVNLIYTPSTGEITGFTIPKGGKQFTAVNKVRIVLVKTGNNSYRIKTFYPYHK